MMVGSTNSFLIVDSAQIFTIASWGSYEKMERGVFSTLMYIHSYIRGESIEGSWIGVFMLFVEK